MSTPILTLTDKAANRVTQLIANGYKQHDDNADIIGLRVSLATKGCSGMAYQVDYATDIKPYEEVVEDKGVKILVDAAAIMFLIGAEMDWQENTFSSTFTFTNPNETARCGCGESVMFDTNS